MSDLKLADPVASLTAAMDFPFGAYAGEPDKSLALVYISDVTALLAQCEALLEALRPFAAVSAKAKGSDDACWCGQDGAVIRYRDLRRAAALVALATSDDPPRPPAD